MTQGTKRILGIYLGLVLAQLICVSAFAIELSRALHGNSLSWAYVFEWPVFSAYAVYMWQKLLKQERLGDEVRSTTPDHDDDLALDQFNEFLRQVHDKTPPTPPDET
ncbi:MAG: hypothetical protein ACYC1I_01115 [Acidimicrobiales bacterium]